MQFFFTFFGCWSEPDLRFGDQSGWSSSLDGLRTEPLHTRSLSLVPRGNLFAMWRMATVGGAVHGGTAALPERGMLLLAEPGAHFHGTTFRRSDP